MNRRRYTLAGLAVVAVSVAVALTAASVQAAGKATITRGGTIVWNCPQSNFTTLDPATGTLSICQRDAYRAMYDTLVSADSKGHITPQAAESWKLDDHDLRITFKLHSGMKFHDGSPVTSADVKYSILRQLKYPGTGGRYITGVIKRIATPDPLTVRITLFHKNYIVFHHIAEAFSIPIINKKIVDANNGVLDSADAGSGPFMLTGVNNGTNGFATFVKFPNYWEKAPDGKPYPYLDGFRINCVVDANTRILNLRSGSADVIELTAPANIKDLAQAGYREVNNYGGVGTTLNINEHVSPFDNPLVRKAIVEALDVDAIAKIWSLGTATVRVTPFAAGSYFDITDVHYPKYDPDQAKADLAKAGFPNGFTTTDTIINQSPDQQVSQIIQQYLKAVGITMNITVLDRATWLTKVAEGTTPLSQQAGNVLVEPDVGSSRFNADPANLVWQRVRWDDGYQKTADKAMQAAEKEPDLAKRKQYYEIVAKQLVAAHIYTYLGNAPSPGFANAKLNGFIVKPEGELDLRHVWQNQGT